MGMMRPTGPFIAGDGGGVRRRAALGKDHSKQWLPLPPEAKSLRSAFATTALLPEC